MARPDDIPEDVWVAACRIWTAAKRRGDRTPEEVIARAILAERERCAKIATSESCGACRAYDEFGSAIRKGGE